MKMRRSMRGAAALALVAVALIAGCGSDSPDALVASAKAYLAKNDRNAAVIQLKSALQKSPDLAEARFLLGATLLETGELPAAENELRKAAELRYPLDQVAPVLARTMVLRGQYRKVLDEFGKSELTSPQSKADLQTSLGLAWLAMGDVEAARGGFAAALGVVPGYPPALLGEARMRAIAGDLPGAMSAVDAALAKWPTFADGWQLKGDLASGQGRLEDALAAYRKALETRPTSLVTHGKIASTLLRQGKNEEAGNQLEAMKKIAPKSPQTLYLQALYYSRAKNLPAARDAIEQQLRAAPDNLSGLMMKAYLDFRVGSYAQAEAGLQKVLQRVPKEKFARMLLVNTFIRSGQPARALDALQPLLDAYKDDSDVLALAGEVFMQNGDTSQAARHFAKAAALDPKNADKRTALALTHLAAGDDGQGFRELQDAAAADSGIRADMALIAVSTRQGKFDVALQAVAAMETKLPDKPLPHNLRGAVLEAKRDLAGARKSYERAAQLDAADFTAASSLARLDLAEKKTADARKRFEAVLAKDPKSAQALVAIAELSAKEGARSDEVVALYQKAVSADPTNAGPRLALISYYMRAKDPRKAVAAAQDALAAIPDRADLMYAAGQAQLAAGDSNQAFQSFQKVAQAAPGSLLPYMKEAEAQFAAKEYDAALRSLAKALALKPDSLDVQRAMIVVHLAKDNLADALAVARTVQTQRPKESTGFVLEGDIYVARKAWSDAAAAYRKGLARAPTTDLAATTHAALRAGGNNADADAFASAWMKDHPNDRAFRSFLAESAVAKGDYATAARQYRAMLELRPDDALALNNLAWTLGRLKDPKAIEYAEKANKLLPNSPAILDTLGMLLVENGDMARGIESMRKATALAPDVPALRLNLARALIKDGQKQAAKKELEVLAKLGDKLPSQPEVAKLMQGL